MIEWLDFTDEQRKAMIDEAEQSSGILAKAIEKDWWVTLVLKALFQSKYKEFIVFKGGTSLSKGWDLIARFSEDIDLALSPVAFGMKYLENPNKGHVQKLKKKGCSFTSNELTTDLKNQLIALGLGVDEVDIIAAPVPDDFPDTDPQTIFVKYRSLYDPNPYLPDEVKIEVSVRSTRTPVTQVNIQSLLVKYYGNEVYKEEPFQVEVVEARKTFIEKMFLLHEEFGKPDKSKIRTERMSRHLYDLSKMSTLQVAKEALSAHNLYDYLIKHREWYSRISWVDYTSLGHLTLSFIPVEEVDDLYRKDYATMREQMIYEDEPATYDEIIDNLKKLLVAVRIKYQTYPDTKY